MIDCNRVEFETVLLGQCFKRSDRLFTVRRVVINKCDFFALDIAAVFIEQIVDNNTRCIPVVCRLVEYPIKHFAVSSGRTTITHGVQWDFISGCFGNELIGNAR